MSDARQIVLVEDEEHLAVGIKYNLEAEGLTVKSFADGSSALSHIVEHQREVSLVILDLMLPGMSGYQVCESLREADIMIPVLILSARTQPDDRARGFDAGADQYLTKPFELDELISRVKNLLARYEREPATEETNLPATYQFGNAKINFQTHDVEIGAKKARLTGLEMKLLKYFVQNEGRVIPRGELLTNVWEMPSSLNTRAPDQIIRRLRKMFEKNSSKPQHFLTIRDAGYRFVASGDAGETDTVYSDAAEADLAADPDLADGADGENP